VDCLQDWSRKRLSESVTYAAVIPIIGPIVEIACLIMITTVAAKNFWRGVPFGIGLSFLPFIFYPILAFSRD
jgi:hypothetical protein